MIRHLNCMTCNARVPRGLRTGALSLLVETAQGLVLVDTGLGREDYSRQPGVLRVLRVATIVPLDPHEVAVRQVVRLGYSPGDVHHIVLTHMHFDHSGGVPDFPHATVHVHRREYEAFSGRPRSWMDLAYVQRHMGHRPTMRLYDDPGDTVFDYPAIRLPFEPAMWLVPLFGHTRGHCGVVVETQAGWHFHAGDAVRAGAEPFGPVWLARMVLGPHCANLLRFRAEHPEITVTAGHMPPAFFSHNAQRPAVRRGASHSSDA